MKKRYFAQKNDILFILTYSYCKYSVDFYGKICYNYCVSSKNRYMRQTQFVKVCLDSRAKISARG